MQPANRLALDYSKEANIFNKLNYGIIDAHAHINGIGATKIYKGVAASYGISLTYSMTLLENVEDVKNILGERVRFIAIPNFGGTDPIFDHGRGYIKRLNEYYKHGARIAKFFSAPRMLDHIKEEFSTNPLKLNSPLRIDAIQAAVDLGMKLMFHVSDPNTWFATKYTDSRKYGTKEQQYEPFREILTRFHVPCLAAHMAGYPEDLNFLSKLLQDHSNLYLDCSATKWMVRELSKHTKQDLLNFFTKWQGRILFGSDIVTSDLHLVSGEKKTEMAAKASSSSEAYDLYASRYWAYRTMFETNYSGESPISDPDLAMVDPANFNELDAPKLVGQVFPSELLKVLYNTAATKFHDISK